MKREVDSPCSECGGKVRPRTIKQEFEREGTRVSVSGIRASVCSKCRRVYLAPGGAQALVEAAKGLLALARRNRRSKGKTASRTIEPWWERIGVFEDDPVFAGAMKLGREYRESLRPGNTGNQRQKKDRLAKKRAAGAALRIRKSHGRTFSNSADLVREDRNR